LPPLTLRRAWIPAAAALCFLVAGLLISHPWPIQARVVWTTGLVVVGLPLVARTAAGVLRGRFTADLVASLAIVTALLLQQPLAGLVVALMQSGGEALESLAAGRAGAALRALEAEAPQVAHRVQGTLTTEVPADVILPGDRIVVRPGEMVPCDGDIESGDAAVDLSRVSGESVPLHGRPGVRLRSGSIVVDSPLTLRVTARASESLYAGIVALVREAQASKAPFQRLADRAAVWFTPLTLAVCAVAWLASRDPVRVLAVLVVATPCPLLLAAPVAFVGGINLAAARGIVVRHGGALEALAGVNIAVFDKTGTLTQGHPTLASTRALPGIDGRAMLGLAAAVEARIGHPLARAVVDAARADGILVEPAMAVRESPGRGVTGIVGDHQVTVGARSLVLDQLGNGSRDSRPAPEDGVQHALVAVDGRVWGTLQFDDPPRPGVRETLDRLAGLGIERQVLLSGDHGETAVRVGSAMGFREIVGDLLPAEKTGWIRRLQSGGGRVLMVGDGINDAPALSAATVGMAVARHGGGIAAESADVVLLHDDTGRIADAVVIGRRTLRIARQSVWIGIGLSGIAMLFAAAGRIAPVAGAVLQEGIDLAVIVNALRVAVGGSTGDGRRATGDGRRATGDGNQEE
jgi:heavy metal translocating P-type ATPase